MGANGATGGNRNSIQFTRCWFLLERVVVLGYTVGG